MVLTWHRSLKIAVGAVALAAAGFAGYLLVDGTQGATAAAQGDCIEVVSAAEARIVRADCGSPAAIYRVGKRIDNPAAACPTGEYSELTTGAAKLCLTLNTKEGDCLTTTAAGRNQVHRRVACDRTAEFRVRKVISGKQDSTLCDPGNVVASYSEPPATICLTNQI
ncbi:LppU/SCO3897 family protein [Actinocrispum wychmicini]|uniref:LppU/SCO3897 family protein n=1 Tax=Actinocrispum wychmicini TaxID=1213861 RepID=UPI00104A1AB2|nr:hypothetical protein [Actinocrispum wychmicini]